MSFLLRLLRFAPAAFLAPLVLFWGLASGGADSTAQGAQLSVGLLGVLALALATSPAEALHGALRTHVLSIGAAVSFLAWSALTTWPLADALAPLGHPLAEKLLWEAPSISIAPASTLLTLVVFFAPISAFVLGALAGYDRDMRAASVRTISALTLIFSLFALNNFAADPRLRLDAGLSSPNAAAVLFGSLAIVALACALRAARRSTQEHSNQILPRSLRWAQAAVSAPLSATAVLLAVACMTLTASRAGSVAVGAGAIVFAAVLFTAPGRDKQSSAFGGLIAGALALVLFGGGYLLDRMETTVSAFAGRQQLFSAHLGAFLERPWLGNGLGSYDQTNGMVMTLDNMGALRSAGAVHNIFLQALEESGIVGAGLLAFAVFPCLFRALAAARRPGPGREWIAALLGVSTILLLHGLADFALQIPAIGAFYGYCLGLFSPALSRRDDGS